MNSTHLPHPTSLIPPPSSLLSHRAFSLVELIVVIGIIGVLAGSLLITFSGSSESARTAACLANMRNLAAACQSYAAKNGKYPLAGSIEYVTIDESDGIARAKSIYHEVPGWISWNSKGVYKSKPTSHQASASWMTSTYSTDREINEYCITNGALYKYLSGSHSSYVCPVHAREKRATPPQWSYVMNAYFGWDDSRGSEFQGEVYNYIEYGFLNRADKVLLFAELPFNKIGSWQPDGSGSGTDCDCVLQYSSGAVDSKSGQTGANSSSSGSYNENIGVNHKSGKQLVANVAFADGHVEKLVIPYTGSLKKPTIDDAMLIELTAWLCTGTDYSFDGKKYEKMND